MAVLVIEADSCKFAAVLPAYVLLQVPASWLTRMVLTSVEKIIVIFNSV